MRKRQREYEVDLAQTKGTLAAVAKDNETLRKENLELTEQKGAQANQLQAQSASMLRQAERIGVLEEQVRDLQTDRLTLIDAMRRAGIPIPALSAEKKPGTGPLGAK